MKDVVYYPNYYARQTSALVLVQVPLENRKGYFVILPKKEVVEIFRLALKAEIL